MTLVHFAGPVNVIDARTVSGTPPTLVGAPPQLHDNSDATYAELETFEDPAVSFADTVSGELEPANVSKNPDLTTMVVRVRYQSLNSDMAPPRAQLTYPFFALVLHSVVLPGPGSSTPTWVDLPITEGSSENRRLMLTGIKSGADITLAVSAPFLSTFSARHSRTRIFEAHLVVIGPSGAASCQNFPADTSNSVGGPVTQFPPSKAVARSNRFGGGYL